MQQIFLTDTDIMKNRFIGSSEIVSRTRMQSSSVAITDTDEEVIRGSDVSEPWALMVVNDTETWGTLHPRYARFCSINAR